MAYKDEKDLNYSKICLTCGKVFYKHKCLSYKEWDTRKFCCWSCRRVEYQVKNNHPWYQGEKTIYEKPCLMCGKIIRVQGLYNFNKRKYCSKSCSAIHHKNNKWTDERKEKLKNKQINKVKSGEWKNPILYDGAIQKIKDTKEKNPKVWTIQERESRSKAMSAAILNGTRVIPTYGKSGHYFSKKLNKKVFYRSMYELQAFKLLEKDNNVIFYKHEPFKIKYFYKNMVLNYIPDLLVKYVDGTQKIIEVKPNCKLKDEKNLKKFEYTRLFCDKNNYIFEIWTENILFKNRKVYDRLRQANFG